MKPPQVPVQSALSAVAFTIHRGQHTDMKNSWFRSCVSSQGAEDVVYLVYEDLFLRGPRIARTSVFCLPSNRAEDSFSVSVLIWLSWSIVVKRWTTSRVPASSPLCRWSGMNPGISLADAHVGVLTSLDCTGVFVGCIWRNLWNRTDLSCCCDAICLQMQFLDRDTVSKVHIEVITS